MSNNLPPANHSYRPQSSTPTNPQRTRKLLALSACAFLFATPAAQAATQPEAVKFVPFEQFLNSTRASSAADLMHRPESKVANAPAVEEMRKAILDRYEGVTVSHSFLLDNQHYDCVPVHQQPAFHTYGIKAAAQAPPLELLTQHQPTANASPSAPKSPEVASFDANGNSTRCEANTVPLLRTTLETMSHFKSLNDFYQKKPGNAVHVAQANFATPGGPAHKYSYTYQFVNNLGGNSNLNLWSPYVNTALGEIFSLSQEWYIGGSGAGTQTEEVGWVVYPAMFNGSEQAHFFIFSTADNYASGCWNNTCGDFVQVASSGLLGNSWSAYSSPGGAQYEFAAKYYLYQGNWWLGYGSTWVGYYPGAKYHGGQNSRYAQIIEFGSESVGSWIWPPEGSGAWSSTGWSHAAYQRNLYYINTSGTSLWDSLNSAQPSPACYSITGPYNNTGAWSRYFYEGGPGGFGC